MWKHNLFSSYWAPFIWCQSGDNNGEEIANCTVCCYQEKSEPIYEDIIIDTINVVLTYALGFQITYGCSCKN